MQIIGILHPSYHSICYICTKQSKSCNYEKVSNSKLCNYEKVSNSSCSCIGQCKCQCL